VNSKQGPFFLIENIERIKEENNLKGKGTPGPAA
jgi:hypothetical protein